MLAGMGVGKGMVNMSSSVQAEVAIAKSGAEITRISPHLMILPFPVNEKTSEMPSKYDPANPDASWVMFPRTPIEHVMGHFSEKDVSAMMKAVQ